MDRWMKITILSLVFLLLFSVDAYSVVTLKDTTLEDYSPTDYMSGINFHPGEICVACHTRFSKDRSYASELPFNVSNNAVLHIFPCSKPACHQTPPTKFNPRGKTRWTLHLKICENCHPRWNSSFETIHNTHLNFSYLTIDRKGVECDICHATPQGYNSSIVHIPPWPTGELEFTGAIRKPDWKGDCAFCHFTINGAERVHDVHTPVILKACPVCHSNYILNSRRMFNRIGVPFPEAEPEKPPSINDRVDKILDSNASIIELPGEDKEGEFKPRIDGPFERVFSEFYLYFDEILNKLLDAFNLVV